MRKLGIALCILAVLLLLTISGCKAEPVTITVNTTTTLTQSTTITQTMASMVTVTSMVTSTITSTQTAASTTTPATTTTFTTTATSGAALATSSDGKLQIVSAAMEKTTIAMYQVIGQVLNVSNQVLNARITVEFIGSSGTVAQTSYTTTADIQPGQQKTFTVSSLDTFDTYSGFNISVEVWQ